jgi:thiosulfate/3-mercaptopyruvate sulfurtransferase
MKEYVAKSNMQIVDARPAGRFEGRDPEPRPGLRQGHIPGAKNVPSSMIVNADGTIKSREELLKIFKEAGINTHDPVVTTCGLGACSASGANYPTLLTS